ncbi:hypothetical protein AB0G64_36115 [Streptomyces longwoodensis]|uniref:hypothetical protein n=1 Tax=Streptomyces longwoodensis TaxID=68231 RepID=UPI0033C1233E
MCANDMRAAAVLAVPFLIRIAADTRHPHRADPLAEVSCPARARHVGVASRDQLLLHRAETYDDLYDGYGVEVSGYPAGWSIAAARAAITADTVLHRFLLDDPDPAIRIRAAYALATATDTDRTVRAVFRTRLGRRARSDRPRRPGPRHRRSHPRSPPPAGHRVDTRAVAGPDTGTRGPAGRRNRLALSH